MAGPAAFSAARLQQRPVSPARSSKLGSAQSACQRTISYGLGLNVGIRPHCLKQFVLCHQPPRVLYQVAQHSKRFEQQQNALVICATHATPQTLIDGVEPE